MVVLRPRSRALAWVLAALLIASPVVGYRVLTTRAATRTAEQTAAAMAAGAIAPLMGEPAQREFDELTSGMDGLRPTIRVGPVRRDGDTAVAALQYDWALTRQAWSYDAALTLVRRGGDWVPLWRPQVLHPELTHDTRLVHRIEWPRRADITDDRGAPLMTYRPVQRIGLNKPDLPRRTWRAAATQLATRLDIDQGAYRSKVATAGPSAFVEALVVRGESPQDTPDVSAVPGVRVEPDTTVLAPSRDFAAGVLGEVTPATAEQVAASAGVLAPGDLVGRSGLQARYDRQLRGRPGEAVVLRARAGVRIADRAAWRIAPEPGVPLRTTLTRDWQTLAERTLARTSSPSALVAISPSTGYVRAAATGRPNRRSGDALTGRFAPGSTFKAVTALALLRDGLTPDSPVNCTNTVTVDGRRFKNYTDFPPARVGRMSLREAIALSCNTALIAEHDRVDGPALRAAAESLGIGQDWDLGAPAFLGSTPDPKNVVGLAESLIGQGLIDTSPLAMATVAASVQAGHTVRPVLLPDHPADPPVARPLTRREADQLRDILHAVVAHGSARFLAGEAQGAKTGTAEYGTDVPPRTHAWMIAYSADVAVAVLVADGDSGSGTAGPLIKAVLR